MMITAQHLHEAIKNLPNYMTYGHDYCQVELLEPHWPLIKHGAEMAQVPKRSILVFRRDYRVRGWVLKCIENGNATIKISD